jgi:glycosyltransferase involved in cell wall biosynthesis
MLDISAAIIAQNEENNIRDCLESVKWASEIVVVDAYSEDETAEVCWRYTDKVFLKEWNGFAEQKQFALDQCTCPWVLSIDADERVTAELHEEILRLFEGEPLFDGYYIARCSYFLGRWMRYGGWYPGYQLRLFRRDAARVSRARVHEGFIVTGKTGTLQHDLLHYSHSSLNESLQKLNRYTSLEALDVYARKRVRWYDFLTHPAGAFLKKYIVQKAVWEGMHGFLLSMIAAFLKMVLYMKIWLIQHSSDDELWRYKETYR